MKKRFSLCAVAVILALSLIACGEKTTPADTTEEVTTAEKIENEFVGSRKIVLEKDSATLDGEEISEYDYTWHCDPSVSHDEVKDAPAEYYTGSLPDETPAVYIDHELYYYPELPTDGFTAINYDGETEWAYYYTDGEHDNYIFATLPHLTNEVPTDMMHSEEEALENKVLHITEAGEYVIEGEWQGQILIDLDGEDVKADHEKKVTVILNGADVTCTVAPAILFKSAYECDNTWEEADENTADVDTTDAGVTVIIADGTENNFSGKNVFRMLKTVLKDEESGSIVQKKMRKTDAAFYSCVTMNICGGAEGDGKLNVTSGFEGLDSELHLSILGGNITINSQDDGMNVNEDNVSVIAFKGGSVTINAALGTEGDGVDSNGYIVIDGGNVSVNGVRRPDSALDSEDGTYYYSGTVTVDGTEQEYTPGEVIKDDFGGPGGDFGGRGEMMHNFGQDFDLKDFKEKVASLPDDATFEDVLGILGMSGMQGDNKGERPEMPDGETPPDAPDSQMGSFGNFGGSEPPAPPQN